MKKKSSHALLGGLSLLLIAASTLPAQTITGTLSNFDVWNRTGMDANDFHITLDGIMPEQVSSTWENANYGMPMIGPSNGGTKIEWNMPGMMTPPDGMEHFGLGIGGNAEPTGVTMEWTFDGDPIGSIPDAWQRWRELTGFGVQDVINNASDDVIWVQRRWDVVDGAVSLGDLLSDGELWANATLIDMEPIQLDQTADAVFDIPVTEGSAFMGYDVFADENGQAGQPLIRFLNAAVVVPEPGGLVLSLLAGMVLLTTCRRQNSRYFRAV